MTTTRDWPNRAEWARQDAIALQLDILHLTTLLEIANRDGNRVEVARLDKLINGKAKKAQEILQAARRRKECD